MPKITVARTYVDQMNTATRCVGHVTYPKKDAAEAMAKLLERIVVLAGEDQSASDWVGAFSAVDAALKPLEAAAKAREQAVRK